MKLVKLVITDMPQPPPAYDVATSQSARSQTEKGSYGKTQLSEYLCFCVVRAASFTIRQRSFLVVNRVISKKKYNDCGLPKTYKLCSYTYVQYECIIFTSFSILYVL